MSEIADAMQRLVEERAADLGADIAAELQTRRDAVAGLDKELAPFHGRDLSPDDIAKLQALMNKRNQAYEMLSQLLKKQQQARNSIITNIR